MARTHRACIRARLYCILEWEGKGPAPAHSLLVEVGRLHIAAHNCPLCPGIHVGNGRHYSLIVSRLKIFAAGIPPVDDSYGVMRLFLRHLRHKCVAS